MMRKSDIFQECQYKAQPHSLVSITILVRPDLDLDVGQCYHHSATFEADTGQSAQSTLAGPFQGLDISTDSRTDPAFNERASTGVKSLHEADDGYD